MSGGRNAPGQARDTIFALASARGRAGIAVIRVSGPKARDVLALLSRRPLPAERKAVVRVLYDPATGDRIDHALTLLFLGNSYTGEDVVELHVHGGMSVVTSLLEVLGRLPGVRAANPGEFTRRAVENGRLDLTQAEAICDLVNAETDAQRRMALRQLDGGLRDLYEGWRTRLVRAAAWIEAAIDFSEEDVPADAVSRSHEVLGEVRNEIRHHLDDGRRGEILRDGFHVAVIGAPNAGKSSLVNALAGRDVAIVSEIPGTTRDVIEVRLDLKGFPVVLADTAGLRESGDAVEREGVRRARAKAEAADLRLAVIDGTDSRETECQGEIEVYSKADLVDHQDRPGLWVSARTGEGMGALVDILAEHARRRLDPGEGPVLTRARHRLALMDAERDLTAALEADAPELAAEDLRLALRALGRITGRVEMEDVLDVVFRDFCIGK